MGSSNFIFIFNLRQNFATILRGIVAVVIEIFAHLSIYVV